MTLLGDRESRLLIDGKLVAGSGGTFPTVNPATPKEVRPFATNKMPAIRTRQQALASTWPNAPFLP